MWTGHSRRTTTEVNSESDLTPSSVNFYPDGTPGMTTDNGAQERETGEQVLWGPAWLPWDWVQGGLSSV